jgi:DNA-binding transcriptional ArsR family regulator
MQAGDETQGERGSSEVDVGAPGETASAPAIESASAPEDAFSRLGNATRLRVIRSLADSESPPTFTDLFEASEEETTAGFAYHLRQLVDHYVEKRPTDEDDEAVDRYVLTSAGRAVASALQAGVYTDRVERGPEGIDGDCPVCTEAELEAALADNVVSVACTACDTVLLTLPFPPNGARDREMPELLDAFDAYHRRRLSLVADGVCPDCAGRAAGRIEGASAPGGPTDEDPEETDQRPVVSASCADCSFSLRAPVSLGVVDHLSVVAFFADHGSEPGPIWNLGPTWREAVLSTDPWAVRVSVRLDAGEGGEELRLLVGDGPTVVDMQRVEPE